MCSVLFFGITMIVLVGLPVNHAMPAAPELTKWPAECEGKTYCTTKPLQYPEKIFDMLLATETPLIIERSGGMENRSSEGADVASCRTKRTMDLLYLIKDENERIRFVAQTETFKDAVQIEECRNPGRAVTAEALDDKLLAKNRVDCYETKVPKKFIVLSLDGTTLESMSPKGGIPASCSAKVIKD